MEVELAKGVVRLGEAIKGRTDDVISGLISRSSNSGRVLDPAVEDDFVQAARISTVAFARWLTGEGPDVARRVGLEASSVFALLAAERAASLNEVTKRCLRWRDSVAEVLEAEAARSGIADDSLGEALAMLRHSSDVTLVRMCEAFEKERHRIYEELSRRRDELVFQATHDSLTGLPNRALIADRVEQKLLRTRHGQEPVAVLFIDLDNFKSVNDTLGHSAGDELLKIVALRLSGALRYTDTLGRLGGDEFIVVAEGDQTVACLIAQRLNDVLHEPFRLPGRENVPLNMTASIGIATDPHETADELLRDADIAMYEAKWSGKDSFVLFESAMRVETSSRVDLERDLRRAFGTNEFALAYQPTFDLGTMKVTGVEALVRWHHPQRGIVMPGEFIPILEESGLIVQLGRWVLTEACRQGAIWHRLGHALTISVNVSARQLDHEEFVGEVASVLAESGLVPEALTLEITESALMRDAEATVERLVALKALGVRIAIDDFGTGYSSLSHLQRFPVDALKIDKSFVTGLLEGREGEVLLRTLVQLGTALGIETLAEGIEVPPQLSQLQDENCEAGQGFLFAEPLDAGEIAGFIENWAAGLAPVRGVLGTTTG